LDDVKVCSLLPFPRCLRRFSAAPFVRKRVLKLCQPMLALQIVNACVHLKQRLAQAS
jgi:hypothetical protein